MNGNSKILFFGAALLAAGYVAYRALAGAGASGGTSGDSSGDTSGGSASGSAGGADSGAFAWLTNAFQSIGQSVGIVQPKGIRNNNPGNLRYVASIPWKGQTGDDGTGYAVFDTPEDGVRALGHQLRTYFGRGINTVGDVLDIATGNVIRRGIIPTYAPSSENDTQAYVDDVAGRIGRYAADTLDQSYIPALAVAIVYHENGQNPYGDDAVGQWAVEP